MRTLRFIGMALFALVLCVNFAACSDDEEESSNTLAGTTWKITSSTEDDGIIGTEITFNSNGTFAMSRNGWTYSTWLLNGEELTLIVGESVPDDYMRGVISVNGNAATFTYHWGDVDGEWEDNENYTMTLQKQ